ncbi:hypothetical protein BJ742DRAFT_852119 [Cladochytrium replicatum]|nr:hypothetical protein BJ742DRAFT_852119 [Cladochytrium replicatum]
MARSKVQRFGSSSTDLALPTADVDVTIVEEDAMNTLSQSRDSTLSRKDTVKLVHSDLRTLKVEDDFTGIRVDLSVSNAKGIASTSLVGLWKLMYPQLKPLTLVLKQLLVKRSFNETYYGGIGKRPGYDASIGELFLGFFRFYHQFPCNSFGISIRRGSFPSMDSEWVQGTIGTRRQFLVVEDPLQPNKDLGRAVYRMEEIKQAISVEFIQMYAMICESRPIASLLHELVMPEEEEWRAVELWREFNQAVHLGTLSALDDVAQAFDTIGEIGWN